MHYEKPAEATKKQEFIDRVKMSIGVIFDSEDTPQARMTKIKKGMSNFFGFIDRPPEEFLADLDKCADITDRDEFIDRVFAILEPIALAKFDRPVEYEEMARKNFLEQGDFTSINQLLAYGVYGDTLYLHVAPNESTSLKDMLGLLKTGLHDLAIVVKDNEAIKDIVGSSWIVAAHGNLMERLGFTIEGPVDEEERLRDFGSAETRDVSKARISREDFLNKYSQ